MHAGSFSCIRIAIVIVALGSGRAYAGFKDAAYAGDGMPVVNEPATDGEEKLEFSVTTEQTNASQPTAPVTAPLPLALVPGGAMLLGSFIATKVFKRKLV